MGIMDALWGTGSAAIQAPMNYIMHGALMSSGFNPVPGWSAGQNKVYQNPFGMVSVGPEHGKYLDRLSGIDVDAQGMFNPSMILDESGKAIPQPKMRNVLGLKMQGPLSGAMSYVSMAGSAYYLMAGFRGEVSDRSGFAGAFDAAVIDVSTMAGFASAAYKYKAAGATSTRAAGLVMKGPGFIRSTSILLAASMGAGMGQSSMGIVGAAAGGYVGARIGRHTGKLAVAGMFMGGAAMVGRGTYQLLKTGYRKAKSSQRIDTSGDIASFYTSNAMTMRSRAVAAIKNSHLNARSALGQEATFLHSQRNYFSPYRR